MNEINTNFPKNILFVGLGVMGMPMAGHLANFLNNENLKTNGKTQLFIFNRSSEKTTKFIHQFKDQFTHIKIIGLNSINELKKLNQKIDLAFLCVKDDLAVNETLFGSQNQGGLFEVLNNNSTVIDHSSISAKTTYAIAEKLTSSGFNFLDAPISGGQVGAQKAQLAIMVGGDNQIFDAYKNILASYGKNITYMGKSGNGQIAKMCNQICIAGIVQSLSESIIFAEKAGLDIETLISVISKGAASSWQMENRAITMHDRKFDFGFAVDLMIKDLNNTLSQAKELNVDLPVCQMVNDFYKQLSDNGDGLSDTSSLIKHFDSI